MKIQIVTFKFAYNYGAWLQMYALQTYLTGQGYDVSVLNYVPAWSQKESHIGGVKPLIISAFATVRAKKFDRETKAYIRLSPLCSSAADAAKLPQPDVYIAGSDQIWNADITDGYENVFFLNFPTTAQKLFYAASIGADVIDYETVSEIKKRLQNVNRISVREKELQSALAEHAEISSDLVLDPVFLPDKKQYDPLLKPCKDKDFVLIYQMQDDERCYTLARRIAAEKGLSIIEIGKIKKRPGVTKTKVTVTQGEFLGYILAASYIVTNSFHGTALSVKFGKQFYSVKLKMRQSRISSLLEKVGLEDRIVSDIEHLKIANINYEIADQKVNQEIERSRSCLRQMIESCK